MSLFKDLKSVRKDNNTYELKKTGLQHTTSPPNNVHVNFQNKRSSAYIHIIKIILTILALSIIGYIIINQFLIAKDFNYSYDLGLDDKHLTPLERVVGAQTYTNLTGSLVYFDIPVSIGAKTVTIQTRFQKNFPDIRGMRVGARNQAVWDYTYKPTYSSVLGDLSKYEHIGSVYRINPNLEVKSLQELKELRSITIATDEDYTPEPIKLQDYSATNTVISTSLRGEQTFYVYTKGTFNVQIKKQDINWYEGEDILEIYLYDLNDNLLGNASILDDGVITIGTQKKAPIQSGGLTVNNLKEGVYKLKVSDADAIVKEIRMNTNKIVSERLFLADNAIYNTETKPSKVYTHITRNGKLRLLTYHAAGLQTVSYKLNGVANTFQLSNRGNPTYLNLTEGQYELTFPNNDVLVSGQYFSFSEDAYFEPFVQKVVSLGNDLSWVENNVDYVVSSYKTPVQDGDWLIGETEFDVNELYVKDGKLSVVFHVPHLDQPEYANYTIPVDWINITVHKPGVFGK